MRPRWAFAVAAGWALGNALSGAVFGVACYQWALATTPSGVVLAIVAATPIMAGAALRPPMLAVKRPAGGIAPARINDIIGLTARVDIPADTPLTWDMLEKPPQND